MYWDVIDSSGRGWGGRGTGVEEDEGDELGTSVSPKDRPVPRTRMAKRVDLVGRGLWSYQVRD